jgi:GNAT superfamily N-acetyltransferase
LTPETIVSEKEEKEFEKFLHNKIKDYNNEKSPYHIEARKPGSFTPLNIILKDNSGNFIGGLSASTYWEWLDIDDFYIPEEFRGKGIGASLIQTAETIAVKRGCTRCFLSTFEFQARGFYEKQGYYVAGKLEDYPPGSDYYWMRKDLLPEQS